MMMMMMMMMTTITKMIVCNPIRCTSYQSYLYTTIIHRCVRYQHICHHHRHSHRNTNIRRTSTACISGTLPAPCIRHHNHNLIQIKPKQTKETRGMMIRKKTEQNNTIQYNPIQYIHNDDDDDDDDVSSSPHQSNPIQSRHTPHGA